MEFQDFADVTVRIVPKHFTLNTYEAIFNELDYVTKFLNTFVIAVGSAVLQTLVCCVIGYGFAKFKFKGSKWIFMLVMLTMIIPHPTLKLSLLKFFQEFDIAGPISTILGGPGILELLGIAGVEGAPALNFTNTYFPFIILSLCGLGFKNGLYIFLLRQFFRGVPDELEESAYIDGTGVFKTFIKIILPLSVPMMITVFLFAFSWQWTDTFYTELFISPNGGVPLLTHLIEKTPASLIKEINNIQEGGAANYIYSAIRGTAGIMIIMPLVIVYVFCQKFLVQGIERSGLTAD
jgi:multiple sugar transport system permease protein